MRALKLNEYIDNILDIEELVHFFDNYNYTKEEIKKDGIVYTPKYISDYIVDLLKPKLDETIFEPSVGHGIFIFSLLEYIQKKYSLTNIELKEYFLNNVFGQDLQSLNIIELKELMVVFFKKLGVNINLSEIKNFKVGDTLDSNNNIKYDIIFGNPPYVNIRVMGEKTIFNLRNDFISCKKGNIDLYYAFIEYAFKYSNRCSFITPNSWLYNTSAKDLRILIKNDLTKIIDFKQIKIFKNASTYTSIFLIDKSSIKKDTLEYSETLNSIVKVINKNELNDSRWSFFNEIKSLYLPNIIYHSPIATLRDKIFTMHNLDYDNKDLVSFYKISKIKEEKDFFVSEKKIIFPYKLDKDLNRFVIKKEEELDNNTLNYLLDNKVELNKRDKGKVDKYESWFAFGRKQGLNTYNDNTFLIIIPGMISKSFKFFSIPFNKINKPFLFSSGFILEVNRIDKNHLLNYLNSTDFREFLVRNGKVWKGNTNDSSYYSLSITQLKLIFNTKV